MTHPAFMARLAGQPVEGPTRTTYAEARADLARLQRSHTVGRLVPRGDVVRVREGA